MTPLVELVQLDLPQLDLAQLDLAQLDLAQLELAQLELLSHSRAFGFDVLKWTRLVQNSARPK
jgi:hypothetical protein